MYFFIPLQTILTQILAVTRNFYAKKTSWSTGIFLHSQLSRVLFLFHCLFIELRFFMQFLLVLRQSLVILVRHGSSIFMNIFSVRVKKSKKKTLVRITNREESILLLEQEYNKA